jgi:hypothetical protein
LSIYATWLPLGGAATYGTADITSLVAIEGDHQSSCPLLAAELK